MADGMIERTLERLEKRKAHLLGLFVRVEREVRKGYHHTSEPGRLWLEQLCVGVGVQICSGEFALGDSLGLNSDPRALATDHWCWADRFSADLEPFDYLVTNYLECFPDPLRVLQSWAGRLKEGGTLGIVARNSDLYETPMGPLENRRRVSCFSMSTLCFTVERAGFSVYWRETYEKEIRIAATRR